MAKRANRSNSRDGVDSDRVGRTGGRRGRERSVNGEIGKRLGRGFWRSKTRADRAHRAGSRGRGTMPFGSNPRAQRATVKVLSKFHGGKNGSGLAKHVNYLTRDSASKDGERGSFFGAQDDKLDGKVIIKEWEGDRHHFRLILSPEKGYDIADMRAYVRDVMQRIERDTGTKLDWIGIEHHNTDNPHAHILFRGKDDQGQDLILRREYIGYGIRQRASEAATDLLGDRTEREMEQAREKEVQAQRYTSLDRTIERHMDEKHVIDVSPNERIGWRRSDRPLVIGRLQWLESMDLAEKIHGTKWQLADDFKQQLRELGAHHDIIKQLYGSLGNQSMYVSREPITQPVSGEVVAVGRVDEITDRRFVVIKEESGAMHYARVADGEAYQSLNIGHVAELGRGAQERREIAQEIVEQAKANDGIYSPTRHLDNLLDHADGEAAWQRAHRISDTAEQLAGRWAGKPGSGITRAEGGDYEVDVAAFEKFMGNQADRETVTGMTDVTNVTLEQGRDLDMGQEL
jgi:type IV secretory pathway VirD2 relaxase